MKFRKVTGLASKVYTEDDIQRMYGPHSIVGLIGGRAADNFAAAAIRQARRDLLGKVFVFEQLECGCLGECLGIAGNRNVKNPATKRICDLHDDTYGEDD